MATITLMGLFDFSRTPSWTTLYVSGSPDSLNLASSLDVSFGGMTQDFQGTFEYSKDLEVTGKVTSFTTTVYEAQSWASYTYSGTTLDAAKLQKLILTPDGAQAFQAYVFEGDDKFFGLTGGVALGYDGNDIFSSGAYPVQGMIHGGVGNDTYVAHQDWAAVVADLSSGRVSSTDSAWKNVLTLISVENLVGTYRGDVLGGNVGANRLDGRAGADTVTYASATAAVQVDLSRGTASGGGGNDVLVSIENAIGGRWADVLVGSSAANVLDGGSGADTMRGGLGNDTYVLNEAGDRVIELAGEGFDTVRSAVSLALNGSLEHLELLGSANLNGTGSAAVNRMIGNAGGNTIAGGGGADTIDGGAGADRLDGGSEADRLIGGDGHDTMSGGSGSDSLNGGAGNDALDGGAGADTLSGGRGDDRYVVDFALDRVDERAGEGVDAVLASVSATLWGHVEKLTLTGSASLSATGNALGNVLTGNAGANRLDGGAGVDVMAGGGGGDTYVVDDGSDRCVELAGGGTDRVQSSVSYVLAAELEHLLLLGSSAISGTGNALGNQIMGNAAANTLNGGGGRDTLSGGGGDDLYVVDDLGEVLRESAGQGVETVYSAVSWILDAAFEKLVLTGAHAINGTGNGAANLLSGNAANNRLDGGAGADVMVGGAGNDTFLIDMSVDRVVESGGAGIDWVISTANFVLPDHVEYLSLGGELALNGTGNALANKLVGNAAANLLDGGPHGAAPDTLIGGAGDDTYRGVFADDVVLERSDGGTDTVLIGGSLTYVMPANVENAVRMGSPAWHFEQYLLVGNTLDNRMTGSFLNDAFRGGAGNDTMVGLGGDDVYEVEEAGDVVIEGAAAGYDMVRSAIDYVAPIGIEEVQLREGSSAVLATGNGLNNMLLGNSGDNVLSGMAGGDTMQGGGGNDLYIVDDSLDSVQDFGGPADLHDIVEASISFDLDASGVEHLRLTGSGDVSGWGTDADNILTGNSGRNTLDGRAGVDTVSYSNADAGVTVSLRAGTALGFGSDTLVGFENLIGSSWDDVLRGDEGANRLQGGSGADRFVFDSAAAADTVADFASGIDTLAFSQATLAVGNGDVQVNGAVTVTGPGGFDAGAELVIVQAPVPGTLDTAAAAVAIGSADSAYAGNQSALFAVVGEFGVGVYRFTSTGADAVVDSAELVLLATLEGSSSLAAGDFLWVA